MLLNVPYHKKTNHATKGFIPLSRKYILENVKGNVMKCFPLVDIYIFLTEAYHPEAINSDPMLGIFSEPIKIYFLIWSY